MMLLQILPDNFEQILPALRPWVDTIGSSAVSEALGSVFAEIEVFHLLGLFMLAGSMILVCLRLIGVGLVEESASSIWRNTRVFLHIGVAMVLITGLMIGTSNADKLYTSVAFLVKMISLVAAIIFTYLVTAPVAKADGAAGGQAKIAMIFALLIWAFSLVLFISKVGLNPGMFHILMAGALMVLATTLGKTRWTFAIGLALALLVWQVLTHTVLAETEAPESLDAYMLTNKVFMYLCGAWVLAFALLSILGKGGPRTSTAFMKTVGYASVLVWVTVAAAGRWIAFAS